jgi:hypothetical protein
LVTKYGYDGHAAYAALPHGHQPWVLKTALEFVESDPGEDVDEEGKKPQRVLVADPSSQVAPGKNATIYKQGLTREAVMKKLRSKAWSHEHQTAVYEVLCLGRECYLVAASLGLKYTTVRQHCSQIRRGIERVDV